MAPGLLDAIAAHLEGAGVARNPRSAGDAPPLWLQPRRGIPAPGEGPKDQPVVIGPDSVLAAFLVDQVPPQPGQGYWQRDVVEFRIRVRRAPDASAIAAGLLREFAPPPGYRAGWTMGGLEVISSRQWNGLAPVPDTQVYGFRVSYLFETYV